eukprot:5863557-Prorocentrum_lima.AAC.1
MRLLGHRTPVDAMLPSSIVRPRSEQAHAAKPGEEEEEEEARRRHHARSKRPHVSLRGRGLGQLFGSGAPG